MSFNKLASLEATLVQNFAATKLDHWHYHEHHKNKKCIEWCVDNVCRGANVPNIKERGQEHRSSFLTDEHFNSRRLWDSRFFYGVFFVSHWPSMDIHFFWKGSPHPVPLFFSKRYSTVWSSMAFKTCSQWISSCNIKWLFGHLWFFLRPLPVSGSSAVVGPSGEFRSMPVQSPPSPSPYPPSLCSRL